MSGRHEPCGASEVWIGNTDNGEGKIAILRDRGIKTVRLGSLAYDIDDKPLPKFYRPLFISRSEIEAYDRIMMSEAFNRNGR